MDVDCSPTVLFIRHGRDKNLYSVLVHCSLISNSVRSHDCEGANPHTLYQLELDKPVLVLEDNDSKALTGHASFSLLANRNPSALQKACRLPMNQSLPVYQILRELLSLEASPTHSLPLCPESSSDSFLVPCILGHSLAELRIIRVEK